MTSQRFIYFDIFVFVSHRSADYIKRREPISPFSELQEPGKWKPSYGFFGSITPGQTGTQFAAE